MMEIEWPDDVIDLPGASEQYDANSELIFRGPRVKIGIYDGTPFKVIPHSASGRADYFG